MSDLETPKRKPTLNEQNKKLKFAGAHNPLILFRDNKQKIIKGDRMSVSFSNGIRQHFTNNEFDIKEGDVLYLFSDGYSDQIGGPKTRKFMSLK